MICCATRSWTVSRLSYFRSMDSRQRILSGLHVHQLGSDSEIVAVFDKAAGEQRVYLQVRRNLLGVDDLSRYLSTDDDGRTVRALT